MSIQIADQSGGAAPQVNIPVAYYLIKINKSTINGYKNEAMQVWQKAHKSVKNQVMKILKKRLSKF